VPLLALFDVDGMLFSTHDPLSRDALRETLAERYGVSLPADSLERVDHRGRKALRIAREVLRNAGLDDAEIDEGLPGWCERFADHLELLRLGRDHAPDLGRVAERAGLHFPPWHRRPHFRPDSSFRSSRGCPESARSTR